MLSWTNFLKVDMNSVGRYIGSGSFYIVEEENMVVVFGGRKRMFRTCIVGENGSYEPFQIQKNPTRTPSENL
ncbi:unnamed protein product [Brassica napus]|uniref:(rape) hypothetical protein n=1 Tax=Brassica napus TaxID=3708 RepID=A0A816JNS4_BRANA|nr:unnamed protein product [Brassica napus]